MEPVKLASGIGGHGAQVLYSGGRQAPPGHPSAPQVVHPATTRSHEGSPYKGAASPPMVSRGTHYHPHPYTSVVDGGHGGSAQRYLQQPAYLTYQRDSHYSRSSMSDRPVLMPQAQKRPSIMGGYGGYTRDIMMLSNATLPVSASGPESCKRIKLTPSKTDVRFPLVIDTDTNHSSRETSYYPQVEAISPTLPPDPRDESPLHSTKDDLLKQIDQVDKEISLTEASLSNLEKKEKELEAAATAAQKGDISLQPEVEDGKDVKHQSTAQIIYAENRKIAEEGHNSLAKLIPPCEMPRVLPLYHQPSDAEVYQQNKAKYSVFKQRLLEYFKKKQELKYNREQQITQTYTKLMNEWLKKVDKVENSKKHKEKVGKSRELFEKVFPELRKQREDKERFSRVGARVKSDAEMEEIIDGIQDQENEDKKMRAYAVIPPILLDEKRRSYRYVNKNAHVEFPMLEYKERKFMNFWSKHERDVFKDKYLQHPKNFVVIASYLEKKSIADCIHNYYLTKKKENYKAMVKRRMRRPRNKGNAQAAVDAMVAINSSTGVTTRGSAAAAQKELMKNGTSTCLSGGAVASSAVIIATTSTTVISIANSLDDEAVAHGDVNGVPLAMVSHAPSLSWSSSPGAVREDTVTITPSGPTQNPDQGEQNDASSPGGSGHQPQSQPGNDASPVAGVAVAAVGEVVKEPSAVNVCGGTGSSAPGTPNNLDFKILSNCQEVREKDKENLSVLSEKMGRRERNKNEDSSDEENIAEHGRGGPHDCVVCKTRLEHFGHSRPVSSGQASQYGLNDASLPPNARVCSNCRCRAVKRRVPQCLILTCTTAKWRVKRLRPFPSRWNHLPASLKDPIIKELKIPSEVTKSCSACHNRIVRKLGSDAEEPLDTSPWSEEDIEALRAALREVGCHWSKVTERVKNKTQGQCKSFYFNLQSKYRLDEALSEYRKSKGKGDPPTVTDEEESGSSTSSCEDSGSLHPPLHHPPPQVRHDSASDTASASSPPPPTLNNIDERKDCSGRDSIIKEPPPPGPHSVLPPSREDNDSSATASADEGQNGVGRDSPEVQHIPHPGERRPSSTPTSTQSMMPGGKTLTNSPSSRAQTLLPPPSSVATLLAPSSCTIPGHEVLVTETTTPNFQEIKDTTVEATLAKSYKEMKLFSEPKSQEPNDRITFTSLLSGRNSVTYDEDCLDLTVKKRDRSPPPPSSHTLPTQAPLITHREMPPTLTMRGGAEVIPTEKRSPPRAHSNSIRYSQTPLPTENTRYMTPEYRKSPSSFSVESRGPNMAPPTPPAIVNISTHVPPPHVGLGYGGQTAIRQSIPLSKSTKPSMAPPFPLSITSSTRVSHAHLSPLPPQNSTGGGRIPLKAEKGTIALHGSITQGTPVNPHTLASVSLSQGNRYEMIANAKPIMTREGGSITQGTPVHHDTKRGVPPPPPSSSIKDSLLIEPRSGVEIIPRPSLSAPYDRGDSYRSPRPTISAPSCYPYGYPTRPLYSDSQMISRQIIETDYLTSQQMTGRRGAPEKEIRVSPRARDQTRDHRVYSHPPATSMDRRTLEQQHQQHQQQQQQQQQQHTRAIDSRMVEHRIEQQRSESSNMAEFRQVEVEGKVRKVQQFIRSPHGYVPIHSQPSVSSGTQQHYLTTTDVRVSRPSASPVSVRDATPTPPTSEALSSHEFRSPGASTPTPPPRLNSVIQRQPPSKPTHLGPAKSGSPRPDPERYSPHTRHLTVIPSVGGEPVSIPDMLQRPGSYPSMELRRDSRAPQGAPTHHERHQLEGIGKQVVETLQNSRYMNEPPSNEREKEIHTVEIREPVDERRLLYDRMEYSRLRIKDDYRNIPGAKLVKDAEDGETGKIIFNYQMEPIKPSPSPKNRIPGGENITANTLIEAIITNHINQGHLEEASRDPRVYRREGSEQPPQSSQSHPHSTPEAEKRVRSPAMVSAYHTTKEKEIVTVEDGTTDLSPSSRHQSHKDGGLSLHTTMAHSHYSKPHNQVHMETVISREFANADSKKLVSTHPYIRPPLEITRTDGRSVTHLSLRSSSQTHHVGSKEGPKETGFDTRAPHHRMPPTTSGANVHIHPGPHLASDERQIIRIAQPQQSQPRSDNPFDLIKNKIQQIYHEDENENASGERRGSDDARHSRSGTPISQQQQLSHQQHQQHSHQQQQQEQQRLHQSQQQHHHHQQQQQQSRQQQQQSSQPPQQHIPPPPRPNAHYDEDHLKKRPRLDLAEGTSQRPPSRPRSTGMSGGSMADGKEEMADSPQSGEMVIDESPRELKPGEVGQNQDKNVRVSVSQYSSSYPGYRGGSNPVPSQVPPSGNSWGISGPPPSSTSGPRPQGYEPNVEPVSDDD